MSVYDETGTTRNTTDADYIAVAALSTGPVVHARNRDEKGNLVITAQRRQGLPYMGSGPPGAGKSSLIEATLREIGFEVIAMDLGVHEPQDISGAVRVDDKPFFTFKSHPDLWDAYNGGEPGFAVLLDDIADAPQALQNATLRLVQTGQVSGHSMFHVPMFMTYNPPKWDPLYELQSKFANRGLHHVMDPRNSHRYEAGEDLSPKFDRTAFAATFDHYMGVAKAVTNQFKMNCNRDDFLSATDPPEFNSAEDYAYPTGRSWSLATAALAGCYAAGIRSKPLVSAAIGTPAAEALLQYAEKMDVPALADILGGKVAWKHLRPDQAYTAAQTGAWAAQTVEEVKAMLDGAKTMRVEVKAPDVMAPALRVMYRRTKTAGDNLSQNDIRSLIQDEIADTMALYQMKAG